MSAAAVHTASNPSMPGEAHPSGRCEALEEDIGVAELAKMVCCLRADMDEIRKSTSSQKIELEDLRQIAGWWSTLVKELRSEMDDVVSKLRGQDRRLDEVASLHKRVRKVEEMSRQTEVLMANKFNKFRQEMVYNIDRLDDDVSEQCDNLSKRLASIEVDLNSPDVTSSSLTSRLKKAQQETSAEPINELPAKTRSLHAQEKRFRSYELTRIIGNDDDDAEDLTKTLLTYEEGCDAVTEKANWAVTQKKNPSRHSKKYLEAPMAVATR